MEDDRRVKACLIETMKYLTFSTGDMEIQDFIQNFADQFDDLSK